MTTKQNHNQNLTDAAVAFATDGDVEALQVVYRDIPAAARGKAALVAMKAISPDSWEAFNDALLSLPASTGSRVAKFSLTDIQKDDIRDAMTGALEAIIDNMVDDFVTGVDDQNRDAIVEAFQSAVARVQKNIATTAIDSSRKHHDVDVTDIVAPGSTLTGKVAGKPVTGTLNDDGTVTVGKNTGSLSAVAKALLGRSQNGWDFWRFDGSTLASIRDAKV